MRFPHESWRPFRVEAALNAPAEAPAWQDVTDRLKGDAGVKIDRGSSERRSSVSAGRAQLVLDNSDGLLSGSLYRKRVRVSYRHPMPGNMLDAESASFEGGTVGAWVPAGAPVPTADTSTVRAHSGTRSMLITWADPGFLPLVGLRVPTVIGRRYVVTAQVWVPAGSPSVVPVIGGVGLGVGSTLTGAWQKLEMEWTAATALSSVQLWPGASTTAGQQAWVDEVLVDEADMPREAVTRRNLATNPRLVGALSEWGGALEYIDPQFSRAILPDAPASTTSTILGGGDPAGSNFTRTIDGGQP